MSEDFKKLHVCLNKETGQIFFASMVAKKGSQADMRSSSEIGKGSGLVMMPVPDNWEGGTFTRDQIENSPEAFEAHINRSEGRGSFHIRILSEAQKNLANRYRQGKFHDDNLKIEISEAGAVVTVKMLGSVGVQSAFRLQSIINEIPKEKNNILLDVVSLTHMASAGVGILYTVLKQLTENGFHIVILVKKKSRLEEILSESKIDQFATIYNDRDTAIAALLIGKHL